jgi:hypothetical protein
MLVVNASGRRRPWLMWLLCRAHGFAPNDVDERARYRGRRNTRGAAGIGIPDRANSESAERRNRDAFPSLRISRYYPL